MDPVRDVSKGLTAAEILRKWREVEHRLAAVDEDSQVAHSLRIESDIYGRAYEELYRAVAVED